MVLFKRTSLRLAAVVLLLSSVLAAGLPGAALAAASVATCAPDSGSATIGGTVTGNGGTPLNTVLVTAYTTYGVHAGSAYTNASGVYQIGNLIGGSYLLTFEPSSGEHYGEWYPDQLTPFTATPVTVAEAGSLAGINAQLALGARISGTVVGLGGGALQSINVSVYDGDGRRVASAFTDAAGNYTTSPGLPSGTYRVEFAGGLGYLGHYYNGAATLEAATPLVVTAPSLRTGINATLAPGGKISGTVTSAATGLPLAGISVSASGEGGSDFDFTDAGGNYELIGLGSGSYTVSAGPSGSANLVRVEREQVVVAAPGTIADIDFALAAGATLGGRVTGPGGTPLNNITVYISNRDGSYQEYVNTNASGDYSAVGLPGGEYRVLFRPNSYIPEAYDNQPDFSQAEYITVPAQGAVSGIDAQLAAGSAVSGRVTDAANGLPIDDVFVEVLDLEGRRVETAFTQADGTYTTPATLPSGQYLVLFNADDRFASCAYVTAYYGGQLRQEDASRLTVSAPTPAANVNAQLTRGSILFGRLTDETTGAPITSGQVSLYDAQNRPVGFGRLTFLGGWYTGTAVPSGSYRLRFSDYDGGYIDEYYNNALRLQDATPVAVTAPNDVDNLNAALAPGATISGRVTAGGTGLAFSDGSVVVTTLAGEEVGYADIENDGSYEVLAGLPTGSYRVLVEPYGDEEGSSSKTYASSFYGGSVTPAGAQGVSVSAPAATSGVDIVLLRGVWLPLARR
jgi:hypothetical protein